MAVFDLSLADIFNGAVEIEKAKYDQRLAGTVEAQANIAQPTFSQNVNAEQDPSGMFSGNISPVKIAGGVVLLLGAGYFLTRKKKRK